MAKTRKLVIKPKVDNKCTWRPSPSQNRDQLGWPAIEMSGGVPLCTTATAAAMDPGEEARQRMGSQVMPVPPPLAVRSIIYVRCASVQPTFSKKSYSGHFTRRTKIPIRHTHARVVIRRCRVRPRPRPRPVYARPHGPLPHCVRPCGPSD